MEPMNTTEEKTYFTEEEAKNFASQNTLGGENSTSRCVDGRYDKKDGMPECSLPGADAGKLLVAFGALNKLGIDINQTIAEKVVEKLLNILGGASNFHFHTDDHNMGEVAQGCGHIKWATNSPEEYGITTEIAILTKKILEKLKMEGAQEEILNGDHQEKAILVVEGEKGVAPKNEEGNQVFVYQKTMAEKTIADFANTLVEIDELTEIDSAKLIEMMNGVAGQQMQATIGHIAKGLPVYSV